MIHISRVDLTERGILLPHDRVGMVIAQPHLILTQQEPYRTPPASKPELLANLTATLAVSRAAPHHAEKTHFTIFPEYSIPGLDGVDLIDKPAVFDLVLDLMGPYIQFSMNPDDP